MAPPRTVVTVFSCSLLLIDRPRKDERLSWPSWLTYSGRFTHISGHPLAVGRAQDSESSTVKDQRSTAAPGNNLSVCPSVTLRRRRYSVETVIYMLKLFSISGGHTILVFYHWVHA